MFLDSTFNGSGRREISLAVEWHDCVWRPAITRRPGAKAGRNAATKPLPVLAFMPHPVRRSNLLSTMKSKIVLPRRRRAAFTLVELLTVIAIIGILAAMLVPVLTAAKKKTLVMKAKTEMVDLVNAINAYDTDYSRFPVSPDEQASAYAGGNNDYTCGYVQYPQAPNQTISWPGIPGWTFGSNSNVISILMDLTKFPNSTATPTPANSNHQKNPKQVKYLNAKLSGYDPSTGVQNPPGGVDNNGNYRDPWGNPYIITMDLSYDDQCSDFVYCRQAISQNGAGSSAGYNGLVNTTDANGNGNHFLYHGKVMVWSAGPDGKVDPTLPATGPNSGVNKDNILSWQ
jgi:prepilin-type N-terminal cleavage/methylation domain-containing protein